MAVEASPALEGKYKVVKVRPGIIELPDLGRIDLRSCSLEQADFFVSRGGKRFPYLEAITEKGK